MRRTERRDGDIQKKAIDPCGSDASVPSILSRSVVLRNGSLHRSGGLLRNCGLSLPVYGTLVGVFAPVTSGTTVTAGSGLTLSVNNTSGSFRSTGEYQIGVASGSQTAQFQQSGNNDGRSLLQLYGFRPTTTGLAPAQSGGNRKKGVF